MGSFTEKKTMNFHKAKTLIAIFVIFTIFGLANAENKKVEPEGLLPVPADGKDKHPLGFSSIFNYALNSTGGLVDWHPLVNKGENKYSNVLRSW